MERRARFLVGLSQLNLTRHDDAFATYKALVDERPTAAVLNNLGVVQLRRGSTATVEDVRAYCAARLAGFKVPEYVDLRDEPLPRNPAGKLLKNLFRGQGTVPFDTSMLE